ncbi:MAG TPA: ABC transporter permease [Anaerolineales bacterium]|nr:ABC transporter permease [Anaerolineales bacterium]
MINQRLLSLIRKEFIQIVRDPRTLYITFAVPVVQIFLLGYTATTDVRNVPLAVFDQDRSPASRRLLDAYRAADYFRLAFDVDSEEEMRRLIENGQARAGLVIPPDYAQQILLGETASVAFVLDGSDPTVASTSLAAAELIGQSHATRLLVDRISRLGAASAVRFPVEVRARVWYNPDLVSAFFMVPALIGMILQLLTSMLTATAIVRERERGTIEQLIVTPIRSWELILGKIIPYVFLAFIDTLEILVVGTLWFGVPIRGSLGLLLALSSLFLVSSLGIGLFLSTVARTQQEAMMLTWFTLLPTVFLSGFFFPLAAMPPVLQWISHLVPLRYYLVIIRSVLLKGVGAQTLIPEIVALAVFGVILMGAAALRFRKRLD